MQLFTIAKQERVYTRVTDFGDVRLGDVFRDGTHTHDGTPNYVVVTRSSGSPSTGVYVRYVSPDDLRSPRLHDDREFFVWDWHFEHGNMERVTFA